MSEITVTIPSAIRSYVATALFNEVRKLRVASGGGKRGHRGLLAKRADELFELARRIDE